MYIVGYIIGVLIQAVICGFAADSIASSKGYDNGFAWGFWLSILGIIVVVARPAINQATPVEEKSSSYTTSSSSYLARNKKEWRCQCGVDNSEGAEYCWNCRRKKDDTLNCQVKCNTVS